MARASTGDRQGPSVEAGWPSVGRPNAQRIWSVWKSGAPVAAEIGRHPLGYALSVYVSGNLLYSSVHPVRKAAEQEACELKRHWLAQS